MASARTRSRTRSRLIAETFQRTEAGRPRKLTSRAHLDRRTDRSSLILRRFLLVHAEMGERRLDEWLARSPGARVRGHGHMAHDRRAARGASRRDDRDPASGPATTLATHRGSPPSVGVACLGARRARDAAVVLLAGRARPTTERPHEEAWRGSVGRRYFRTSHALLDELRTYFEHGPSERSRGPARGRRRDLPRLDARPRVARALRRPATASPPPTRGSSGRGAR